MATRPRQEPGLACQECRRKKLRCDRNRPCGGCVDSGVVCYVKEDRPSRGPKRGHLKELRSKIAALERQIPAHNEALMQQPNGMSISQFDEEVAAVTGGEVVEVNKDLLSSPQALQMTPNSSSMSTDSQQPTSGDPSAGLQQFTGPARTPSALGATSAVIPTLTRADLDQLYFDRVHVFTPILQQSRYLSWARQPPPSDSHVCLQYAVWTMAAALSSQFQPLRDDLYRDTRRMLDTLELEDNVQEDVFLLQRAQAWTLIAVYESMRTTFRRAWISAGRAFRLTQLMKLNEIDCPDASPPGMAMPFLGQLDCIEAEEKRRTFWTVFCLDRYMCVLEGHPLTVNEDMASVRLPTSEAEFQSGAVGMAPFLSDLMATTNDDPMSPFAECIVFAAIWGRVLCHQQLYVAEQASGKSATEFWSRHFWLDNLLTKRIQLHQQSYPAPSIWVEPMLLFTSMTAQAVILSLCKVVESATCKTRLYRDIVAQYRQKSCAAAQEIAMLSKNLSQLNCFKVHPFISIPLLLTQQYFVTSRGSDYPFDGGGFIEITEVIRELKEANLLCHAHLTLFEATTADNFLNWDDENFHLQLEQA